MNASSQRRIALPKRVLALVGAVVLVSVLTAAPARAQWPATVLGNVWAEDTFNNSYKFNVHYAAGRYWAAIPDGGDSVTGSGCPGSPGPYGPQRLRVYTSANGTAWSQATYANPTSPPFDFCVNGASWSFRFLGNVIVAFARVNTGEAPAGKYYSKGTLDASGTVTWQRRQVRFTTDLTEKRVTAAIVNGRPVMWASTDDAVPPAAPAPTLGHVLVGSQLDTPTWAGPYVPPALNTGVGAGVGTNGSSQGAAVFPLFGADPNDFIVIRATSWMTSGGLPANPGQSQRLVSIKYHASTGTFDTSWFNVSTEGGRSTIPEDATTQVYSGDYASGTTGPDRGFAATQQPDGRIHVVYVNQNGDIVHYRRAPGLTETEAEPATDHLNGWKRVAVDVDGPGSPVSKVGLTVIDDNNLLVFYVRNTLPETIYSRRFDGVAWGAETVIRDGSTAPADVNSALGTMETATGCNAGVIWNEGVATGPPWVEGTPPVTIYFKPANPSCTPPTVYLRSIGTRADYGTNMAEGLGTTVTVTNGSKVVNGTGTAWIAANRGMGDVIVIPCADPPTCTGGTPYMIANTLSETQLTLTAPAGTSGSSSYVVRRQFQSAAGNAGPALLAWEDCIDGLANGGACSYFTPASASLVADNRVEIGVLYKDSVAMPAATANGGLRIAGARTSATHHVVLTVAPRNRHNGTPAAAGCTTDCASAVYQGATPAPTTDVFNTLRIYDNNVTVEWLELRGFHGGLTAQSPGKVYGVVVITGNSMTAAAQNAVLDHLLIHDFADADTTVEWDGVRHSGECCTSATIRNTMIWDGDRKAIEGDEWGDTLRIENCTIDDMHGPGPSPDGIDTERSVLTVRNTISTRTAATRDFSVVTDGGFATDGTANHSSNNTSSDATAPGPNAQTNVLATNLYVSAGSDLHLKSGAAAIDGGLNLASSMSAIDIDGQVRPSGAGWDRGADEFGGTTAVQLMSFEAAGADGAVDLSWQTGSELDNLGFHLYRSLSGSGPWTRITSSLIPGLGASALGASYSWRDTGLANGTRYHYRLEDVDTSSVSTFHGPVWAVPGPASSLPAPSPPGEDGGGDGGGDDAERGDPGISSSSCPSWLLAAAPDAVSPTCTSHGDPDSVSLDVLARDSRSTTLELRTGGFYALHEPSGLVRVFVRGFELPSDPRAAALPVRRAVVDAVVGRGVAVEAVRATDEVGFSGLLPASVGRPEMRVGWDGTVVASRREGGPPVREGPARSPVRLLPSVFQGERKSAVLEISPLRLGRASGELRLSRRIVVRLAFTSREAGEIGRGSVGRARPVRRTATAPVLARLYTTRLGLHAVSFESLFPGRTRAMAASTLRLERQGVVQAFHLEPAGDAFGPGSRLLFHAHTVAGSTDFSSETAWEVVLSLHGTRMPVHEAAPEGDEVPSPPTARVSFETNRLYLPGLLEAEDPWLWEPVAERETTTVGFSLSGLDASAGGSAEVEVFLQGGSESGGGTDHHVSVSVNGVLGGEAEFAGKTPYRMSVSVPASVLRGGGNELSVTNVGDTGVFSCVYLDRFVVSFPQRSSLVGGVFEGSWAESGTVTLGGLTAPVVLLDVTASPASWLTDQVTAGSSVRFRAEAGRRYLAVSEAGLVAPRVVVPRDSPGLSSTANQADYIVITPRAFLGAAGPLLERRRDQGLRSRAVTLEQIADEFGHGQASAAAIRDFLVFAFHAWRRPSPRYVLLLGDSSYDPRNFSGASPPSPLPALWKKTSYLWTVSDPELAAVNGEDSLPDFAIGRLTVGTVEEAEALVAKSLAWEETGGGLAGRVALVADDSDLAGDFEGSVEDLARSVLQGREVTTLKVRELGNATRPAIRHALDSGLGLMSYVGHGGAAVWASENVWNTWDAPSLAAQSEQPVLLTLNCLNGYFVGPAVDSLSESLVKARGRGAIAAISPSGLSLDGPAHELHRAIVSELVGGGHERLGDAVMAAQAAYARTGLMPELVSVYHLFGDPALKIR